MGKKKKAQRKLQQSTRTVKNVTPRSGKTPVPGKKTKKGRSDQVKKGKRGNSGKKKKREASARCKKKGKKGGEKY